MYWRRSGEYVQRCVCFVNIQSSLHENVVFSVCACLGNAAYIIFIMLNSISDLDAWYHFRFNISCVAVTVRGHQKNIGESYLVEQFRQITHYSVEQFCQITHYLGELCDLDNFW